MDELEQLYQTTYTAVARFLYRKVWDAERAEDLLRRLPIPARRLASALRWQRAGVDR